MKIESHLCICFMAQISHFPTMEQLFPSTIVKEMCSKSTSFVSFLEFGGSTPSRILSYRIFKSYYNLVSRFCSCTEQLKVPSSEQFNGKMVLGNPDRQNWNLKTLSNANLRHRKSPDLQFPTPKHISGCRTIKKRLVLSPMRLSRS